ncbi:MAG: M1 family metallopeptidase [Chitinophagales bacterium]|nr:M1 family metallopeptidase [Chitinophagales bacterium]
MRSLLYTVLVAVLTLIISCTPKNAPKISGNPSKAPEPAWDTLNKPGMNEEEEPLEYNVLDDIVVEPQSSYNQDSLRPYNASHTFEVDLIHTKVDISFDWTKKRANGKATLTMRPWFYATDKVTLDAKNFDIQSVTFEGKTDELKREYNNEQLTIQLGRAYTRNEEFKITIAYTAKPDERETYGGSAAITSDKGLYFINPDGADKEKPMQIWTQGETESNSFWMPTVDKPNERCTQEMYITVADKYKTLSNGVLVSSKKNADGTRTDYWKMDKPHAPYLFMMAVGDFAVVKDKWRGIDVDYYVEPKFEAHARDIYPYTTEMLEFFSNKLGYAYPWQKFSQIIVRDYVSGAMENTTAVIFGDFMQKTKRELLDDHMTNEKVVAHEMFHHWFGDLVTTESWANLTMNEGFANYSEYLWIEHKHGRDAADEHLMVEQQGYYYSAGDGGHPLIHFGYNNREDMFDAHSYNKGGCVLHMLRQLVGDEAFFAALNRYLKRNEYTDVEAHELRLAFEDVTGQDLNWFFNQWYFGSGHPQMDIDYGWDETTKKATVTVTQAQEGADVARVFELPLSIDIYEAAGKVRRENVRMTQRQQTFTFDCASKPALINFDATKTLLCQKNDHHTAEEWAFMYRNAPLFRDRYEALEALQAEPTDLTNAVFTEALSDKYFGIRQQALMAEGVGSPAALPTIAKLAETDAEPGVRVAAINILSSTGDKQYLPVFQKNMGSDQAYSVVSAALSAMQKIDPAAAREASKTLQNDESDAFTPVLTELYAEQPSRENLAFFEQKLPKADGFNAFPFFDNYQKFLLGLGDQALIDNGVATFKSISLNPQNSEWRRFGATKAIADLRNHYREKGNAAKIAELEAILTEIKAKETDPTLKLYYDMF